MIDIRQQIPEINDNQFKILNRYIDDLMAAMGPQYKYIAKLVKITDADTIVLDVDLGFRTHTILPFRVYGIDAPERYTEDGKFAIEYVDNLFLNATQITIETFKNPQDKYGRWLANIYLDGVSLADSLVNAGLAVRYMP